MKKIKYFLFIFIFFSSVLILSACQVNMSSNSDKLQIVTTIFPIYDFSKQIAKDKADVTLILPPGVEPHSFDPTPKSIFKIRSSDLFVYTNKSMEPWVNRILNILDEDKINIVNSSENVSLISFHEDDEQVDYLHNEFETDPHIWLSPLNAVIMVDNITKGLVEVDPTNEDFYIQNAVSYKQELLSLHQKYLDLFENTTYKTIIFGGHFAFRYLTDLYNLDHISPYDGFAPNAEPTPKKVQDLINYFEETGQHTIYFEELIEPRVAKVISENTGANMLILNGAHNISKTDLINGKTFLSIMEENIENLKVGLEYNE